MGGPAAVAGCIMVGVPGGWCWSDLCWGMLGTTHRGTNRQVSDATSTETFPPGLNSATFEHIANCQKQSYRGNRLT